MKYSFKNAPLGWKIWTVLWGLLFLLYAVSILERPNHRPELYITMIIWTGIHFLPLLLKPRFVQVIAKVNFFLYLLLAAFAFFNSPWQQAIGLIIASTFYGIYAYYVIYNKNANAYIEFGVNYKDVFSDRKQNVKESEYLVKKETVRSAPLSDIPKTSSKKKEESAFKTTSVEEERPIDTQREKSKPSDLTSVGFKVVNKSKEE